MDMVYSHLKDALRRVTDLYCPRRPENRSQKEAREAFSDARVLEWAHPTGFRAGMSHEFALRQINVMQTLQWMMQILQQLNCYRAATLTALTLRNPGLTNQFKIEQRFVSVCEWQLVLSLLSLIHSLRDIGVDLLEHTNRKTEGVFPLWYKSGVLHHPFPKLEGVHPTCTSLLTKWMQHLHASIGRCMPLLNTLSVDWSIRIVMTFSTASLGCFSMQIAHGNHYLL